MVDSSFPILQNIEYQPTTFQNNLNYRCNRMDFVTKTMNIIRAIKKKMKLISRMNNSHLKKLNNANKDEHKNSKIR